MPIMDQTTFVSEQVSHINYMSINGSEGDYDEEYYRKLYWDFFLEKFEKLRYCVVYKFGDLYYQKMSKEDAFKIAWHFESDPKKTLKN